MNKYSTLVELLSHRAQAQPQAIAYTFLSDKHSIAANLTYQQLDQQARAVAVVLQSMTKKGDRAMLVYPYNAGLEFIAAFFGCIYAGVIAVPCNAPRHYREIAGRLQERFVSSQSTVAITCSSLWDSFKSQWQQDEGVQAELKQIRWLIADTVPLHEGDNWRSPDIDQNTLAYLQFTSGSTGAPKGVMISHQNVIENCRVINRGFENRPDSIEVMWLPLFHDMGLVGGVMQPLYIGFRSILMSPISLIQKPFRWLELISQHRATVSGGPNFAYDLLCHKVTDEQRATLDLSSWTTAFTGAEPVRAETIENFTRLYADCGFKPEAFYPCYGMAETTLFISGGRKQDQPIVKYIDGSALEQNQVVEVDAQHPKAKEIVGCGRAWETDEIKIVDPDTLVECDANRIGEIWVSGSGVGQGYWNQPEETAAIFQAKIANAADQKFWLRTGDLGFLQGEELFITGRLKEIIIIWGNNRYPQHLELSVQKSHPALRLNAGAAFGVEVDGEERLVIAQEVERTALRNLNVEEVIGAIRLALAEEHMLEVYGVVLIKTASLPKTSSGKVQRRASRARYLEGTLDVVAQWHLEKDQRASDITDLLGQRAARST